MELWAWRVLCSWPECKNLLTVCLWASAGHIAQRNIIRRAKRGSQLVFPGSIGAVTACLVKDNRFDEIACVFFCQAWSMRQDFLRF